MVHRNDHQRVANTPLLQDRHVLYAVIQVMIAECYCVIVVTADFTGIV